MSGRGGTTALSGMVVQVLRNLKRFMSEMITGCSGTKAEKYSSLLPQVEALISGEKDTIANMANVAAVLKAVFRFWWVGFYRVVGEELVLGPFQGPLACTRIACGRGVCGTAWKEGRTIVVPDVALFPGHIACSSDSRSEIVVPLFDKDGPARGRVTAVLDIDSEKLNAFDRVDKEYLEKIAACLQRT